MPDNLVPLACYDGWRGPFTFSTSDHWALSAAVNMCNDEKFWRSAEGKAELNRLWRLNNGYVEREAERRAGLAALTAAEHNTGPPPYTPHRPCSSCCFFGHTAGGVAPVPALAAAVAGLHAGESYLISAPFPLNLDPIGHSGAPGKHFRRGAIHGCGLQVPRGTMMTEFDVEVRH